MRHLIIETFEKLEHDGVQNIIQGLAAAGLEKYEDFDYITETDLKDYLKPIQFRKLMRAFKSAGM